MSGNELNLEYIPEDVLREVLEAEKEFRKSKRKGRARYPTSRDLVEVVKETSQVCRGIHPHEFPQLVLKALEQRGFSTKYVTIKRIWSVYEALVRRHVIVDVLGVVKED